VVVDRRGTFADALSLARLAADHPEDWMPWHDAPVEVNVFARRSIEPVAEGERHRRIVEGGSAP
jgi:hypothetical protein